MAKKNVGRLAGLAALAGAAYMMSRGKGKSDDAGDQKTSSYTKDTKKSESKDESFKPTNESAYASRSNMTPMRGVGDATNGMDSPKPKVEAQVDKEAKGNADAKTFKSVSEPSDKSIKLAPERRDLEKNTSRGIPAKQKPASTVSSSEAGMKNYKPRRTPAAPASAPTTSKTPDAPKSAATTDKFKHEMPIAKFFKGIREAGNRGNPDAKMASGGMTASRRGDGIATKGKTRCKMY
jgi:hypothetical protein